MGRLDELDEIERAVVLPKPKDEPPSCCDYVEGRFCQAMDAYLNPAYNDPGQGFTVVRLANLDTGARRIAGVRLRRRGKTDIFLSYCPWCGGVLREGLTQMRFRGELDFEQDISPGGGRLVSRLSGDDTHVALHVVSYDPDIEHPWLRSFRGRQAVAFVVVQETPEDDEVVDG